VFVNYGVSGEALEKRGSELALSVGLRADHPEGRRFDRRRRIADLTDFLLRRAATRPTITYRQLVDGAQINGALPALTG
jgi:hypothetical protein